MGLFNKLKGIYLYMGGRVEQAKPRTVYLSGKIGGLEWGDAVHNFQVAEHYVKKELFLVRKIVNPTQNSLPRTASWEEHLAKDLNDMIDCDTIAMLPNWQDSSGAKLEHEFAKVRGYNIVYLPESVWYLGRKEKI